MNTSIRLGLLVFSILAASFAPLRAQSAETPADEMANAARNFLAALSPEQQAKATFDFAADERMNWHFIPKPRKGLTLKDMATAQRHLAYGLLSSAMSQKGFLKATTIMSLEQILKEMETSGPTRDPELYYFSVFGKPDSAATWGWRVEGHHLSLNFTIFEGKAVSVTPSFMGTNPGEVRQGARKGLRVLGKEEELARQLVKSLSDAQKQVAIYTNTAPADVITSADRKARVLTPAGLAQSEMNAEQSALLTSVVKEYVGRYRGELAEKDLRKMQAAGPAHIHFAWAGGLELGQPHYYRVQGPGFLLEYDNTQNNANHVHAVWRDLENDFGQDPLGQHYKENHSK